MAARLLDGQRVASDIRAELVSRVQACRTRAGRPPRLGILLVGEDPGSRVYVGTKQRAGAELGVDVDVVRLQATAGLSAARAVVERFNRSAEHDGLIVQSPLPPALGPGAAQALFDAIDPVKDVDGFHPINVARLVQGRATLAPCTPSGILELLDRSGVPLEGIHAVVIGRSQIVGKPVALMLLHRHATVTICHSRTRDLPAVAAGADLLVVALGRPGFVTPAFVKPGAVVVDVGITRVEDPEVVNALLPAESPRRAAFERRGALLFGDVHPAVAEVAGALTPVPGGVGPMTVAMLLANTVRVAEARLAAQP